MKSKPVLPMGDLNGIFTWRRSYEIAGRITTGHVDIDRCLDFIIKNFRRPIQLKDLVKISGMSRRGFCKAFCKKVGGNPGAVLRYIRVEYAKRLLIEDDLVLRQIARQCGYRSENTFCVAFQRATKTSPKKFQRQYLLAIYRNHPNGEIQPLIANRVFPPTWDGNVSVLFSNSIHQKSSAESRVA